jgi:hypothetical protein
MGSRRVGALLSDARLRAAPARSADSLHDAEDGKMAQDGLGRQLLRRPLAMRWRVTRRLVELMSVGDPIERTAGSHPLDAAVHFEHSPA